MREAAESGTVVPFERNAPERDEYEQAVRLWCLERNLSEALSREELAGMQRLDRMDAQRKALILNLIHYFRKHERADVAPGVAVIIHLMSDNDKGASTVSQATMAKLFNRSGSSIADAHRRLKEDEIIIAGRGRYPMTYPVVPRAVARSYNHLAWLLSAAADTAAKPLNLPVPSEDCQSSGQTRRLNQSLGGTRELNSVNLPVEDVSILRPDPKQLQSRTSTVVDRAAKVVVSAIATAMGSLPAAANPPEPPAIIKPSSELTVHELAEKLHDAGGRPLNLTSIALQIMEVPKNWIAAGCDLERDILPTIRAMVARKEPNSVSTWKYFERAIMTAKAARLAPLAEGSLPQARAPDWRDDADARKKDLRAALEKYRG